MKTKLLFILILCSTMTTVFSQIPTNGLVAWYPFNGNANDASGNGNNGIVYGATLTTDRYGNPNQAYSFDGVNDYINSSFPAIVSAVSISFWFYSTASYSNGPNFLETSSSNCGIGQSSGSIDYAQNTSVQNYYVNSGALNPLGNWHFVVIIYSANYIYIYYDGIFKNQTATTGTLTPVSSLLLGKRPNNTGLYNGKLDDIRVFNRALNQAEINALFNENLSSNSTIPNNLTSVPEPNCLKLTNLATSGWKWSTGETTKSITVCKSGNYSCNTDSIGAFISKFNDSLYTPNGKVHAIVRKGDTVYFGGQFDYLARPTGCGALFNLPRDANVTNMPRPNGKVHMVVPDGLGGWYLAGDFTKLGLDSIRYIAHIKSDKKVDTAFHLNPNGRVNTLYVAGNRLFVGGSFTKVGDVVRNYLVMVDKTTGQANSWNSSVNGVVNSVTMFGNNLYVGGTFTSIGGQTRNRLASVDTVNALATTWNPNPDNLVRKLVLNGLKLYVLGDFTTIVGQPRTRLASFTMSTGNLDTWSPNPNGRVYDLVVSGTNVNYYPGAIYVCGGFSQIGGAIRNYLAALDNTNGNVTPWTPVTHDTVMSMAIMDNLLFAGGKFVWVNTSGANAGRTGLCSFDLNNTGQVTAWVPNPINTFGKLHSIITLAAYNNQVYAGGDFFGVKCNNNYKPYIAAINAVTGVALIFNPYTNGVVRTFHINGNYLYVGGDFTEIQNWGTNTMLPRNRIAQVVLGTNGSVTGWNPDANGSVMSIASKGLYIYAGGTFSTIGGNPRPRLSAIKISDGTSSTWTPSPNDTVKCLAVGGDTLFVGGDFTSIASATRNRLASFGLTGNTLTTFDPNANGEVNAIAFKNNKLFAGGLFTNIAGASRLRFASFNVKTNAITSLDPLASGFTYNSVTSLFASDSAIYVSGNFSLPNFYSNMNNPNVCAVKINNSNRSKWWHPDPNGTVRTMFLYQDKMYLGGDFTESLNIYQPFFTCVDNFCSVDNNLPVPADTNFCQGDSVPLWAAMGVGYTYKWYKDNVLLTGATKRYYIPIATGWYKALITDTINYGSLYTNAQHVIVDPMAPTTITASGPLIFCGSSGHSVVLTAASGSGYSYQWYKNNVVIGGANSINYTATTSGNYYCDVYNASGCPKHSQTVIVNATGIIPVLSLTGTNPFCQGTTVTLNSNFSTGYFHQWFKNNVKIQGSTGQSLIVSTAGAYKVRDSIGSCAGFSNEIVITVNPLPVPTITGATSVCIGSSGVTYTTETGMIGYAWTISAGGTIIAGSGTNQITVTWNTAGAQTASVNYTNSNSCTAASATVKNITVNPLPAPTINGSVNICVGSTEVIYSTESGMTGYIWAVSSGGTITAGSGTNQITVTWSTSGAKTVSVNYSNSNSCTAASATVKNVTVNPLPDASGSITGASNVIQGQTGVAYSVGAIANANGYSWTLPTGAGITAGNNTNSILVSFSPTATSGIMRVAGTNSCGSGAWSPDFSITVNPAVPATKTITNQIVANGQTKCYDATQVITVAGNGTIFFILTGGNATFIAGQKISFLPGTTVQSGGYMWGYIAPEGPYCTNPSMPLVATKEDEIPWDIEQSSFKIYPNPTTGSFILELTGEAPIDKVTTVDIYGIWGEKVLTKILSGERKHEFSLSDKPVGVYFIQVISGDHAETLKIVKQ